MKQTYKGHDWGMERNFFYGFKITALNKNAFLHIY